MNDFEVSQEYLDKIAKRISDGLLNVVSQEVSILENSSNYSIKVVAREDISLQRISLLNRIDKMVLFSTKVDIVPTLLIHFLVSF